MQAESAASVQAVDREGEGAVDALPGRVVLSRRLSTRVLWLTMLAVMIAEVLIFVPSIANFRNAWLLQKIETAAVAGLTAEQARADGGPVLGPEQQAQLLRALDADLIAIANEGATRLLARSETLGPVDTQIDLGAQSALQLIGGAFNTLLFGGDRMMRIVGPVGEEGITAEVVMPEKKLVRAMLIYSRNIFVLSLAIASFAALLVFAAISYLLIRPIRGMTRSMVRFGENPADAERIIAPSGRRDEIGVAE
ncbi:MAG: sensor histidine kinase, partial [Rhizobiaceae bacterium]|nr:sensor histidine kinase [Rhizobiaceae bacterium]